MTSARSNSPELAAARLESSLRRQNQQFSATDQEISVSTSGPATGTWKSRCHRTGLPGAVYRCGLLLGMACRNTE